MFIPDDESGSKTYNISKKMIRISIYSFILFLITFFIFIYNFIPKVSDYIKIKEQHDKFVAERIRVLELTRDFERLKQMDNLVRGTLGTKLDIDEKPLVNDTLTGATLDQNTALSYLENIPSVAPIQGYISQRSRKNSLFIQKHHYGIDIVSKEGEPILASASGVVVFSGWTYEFGNLIIIYHGDNYFTHYGHNQHNLKTSREIVTRGEIIGLVGSTGVSSGPHLHYEVWKEFIAVDPLIYFPEYARVDLTSSYYD